MSIQASTFVWQQSKQKQTALLVLLAIADFADKNTGQCFPGVKTLAEMARTTVRNTQLILRRLAHEGEIRIDERTGRSSQYTLVGYCEWLIGGMNPDSGVRGVGDEIQRTEGVKPDSGGDEIQRTEGVKPDSSEPLIESIKEPERTNPSRSDQPNAKFIAIWESALGQLEALLDRQSYQFWLKKAALAGIEEQMLVVRVRSQEVADYCQGRLGRVVTRVVNDAAEIHGMDSGDWQVRFECNPTRCTPPPAPPQRIGRGETTPAITPVAVTTPLPKVWKVPSRAMAMVGAGD